MKKPSAETELRNLKRANKELQARFATAKQLNRILIRIGASMSNICFNLGHANYVPDEVKACIVAVRKEWDAAQ